MTVEPLDFLLFAVSLLLLLHKLGDNFIMIQSYNEKATKNTK